MSAEQCIRILYMEDERGLGRLLQRRLERLGYAVDLADNGDEGLAMYAQGQHDALLVDQWMPVLDGLAALRVLAAQQPLPPTVMLTASENDDIAEQARALGVQEFLVKDVQGEYLDALPEILTRLLPAKSP